MNYIAIAVTVAFIVTTFIILILARSIKNEDISKIAYILFFMNVRDIVLIYIIINYLDGLSISSWLYVPMIIAYTQFSPLALIYWYFTGCQGSAGQDDNIDGSGGVFSHIPNEPDR